MLFRQAGIFHTNYDADRALFPIPGDRIMIGGLLALAILAPLYLNSLYLSSFILPWLVWTAATLGLNLIIGWAGQFHLGYAAVMGIGAYATVHATRFGVPWEIAIVLGGLTAAVIGVVFAFASLRVKGLYLALSTLALQFVMDWTISHVPAISGGTQATLQAPRHQAPWPAGAVGSWPLLHCARLVRACDSVYAQPLPHGAWPCSCRSPREGLCGRGDWGEQLLFQAHRLRDVIVHRRCLGRDPDRHVLSCGHAGTVFRRCFDPGARDGHRRRTGLDHRQLFRRWVHSADARDHEFLHLLARHEVRTFRLASRRWRTFHARSTAH